MWVHALLEDPIAAIFLIQTIRVFFPTTQLPQPTKSKEIQELILKGRNESSGSSSWQLSCWSVLGEAWAYTFVPVPHLQCSLHLSAGVTQMGDIARYHTGSYNQVLRLETAASSILLFAHMLSSERPAGLPTEAGLQKILSTHSCRSFHVDTFAPIYIHLQRLSVRPQFRHRQYKQGGGFLYIANFAIIIVAVLFLLPRTYLEGPKLSQRWNSHCGYT